MKWTAALSLALAIGAAPRAPAAATDPKAAARAEIWAMEQQIYAGRAKGDLGFYLASVAEDYAAWPPSRPGPAAVDGLKASAAAMAGKTGERQALTLVDFRLNGSTGVIYYQVRLSATADGAPADEVYDNIHVWVRQGGAWRLLGGMARPRAMGDR